MEENNKKEGKKSKKKIIITIVIIAVLIFVLAGCFIFYHGNQTTKLISEVNKLTEIEMFNEDGTVKENPIDMEIKTTGSYAVVEKTLKDYLNEVFTETQNLTEVLKEDELISLTSFENIKEDGKDFTKSKEKIAKMKETLNNYVSKMEELVSEEKMLERINDKDIGEYYKELYRQLAVDEETSIGMKEAIEELKTSSEEVTTVLNALEEMFNFLSENKDKWNIENEQIMFTTQSAYEEYQNIMSSLQGV